MQTGQKIGKNRKFILLSVVLLAMAGFGAYVASSWNHKGSESPSGFRRAPDFTLPDAAGKSHSLSDFRGKVVLLHFWASWCPPCLGEIPQWVELASEFKAKPIQLLAVSLDENWQAAHKVLPSDKLPEGVISVIDPQTRVSEEYGSFAFPETYLISPKGEIITKWIGPQDWKNPEFARMMDELFKKSEK